MSELFPLDLAVIGGGAAGFFGAINLAERLPTARIAIFEKGSKLLSKVLISGGGRCNVTNACFDPALLAQNYPRGSKELRAAFHRFQPRDTVEWFARHKVELKTEPDGRMFPTSNNSETIARCFTEEAARRRIQVRMQSPVERLERTENSWRLRLRGGEEVFARCVLLTSGGDRESFSLAAQAGHTIIPPVPSLFTFNIADPRLAGISGVAVPDAQVSLPASGQAQRGAVLITHWGLSGPAVIRLSAWAARELADSGYKAELRVNWLPARNPDQIMQLFNSERKQHPQQQPAAHCPMEDFPQRLWRQLVDSVLPAGKTWTACSNKQLNRLAEELNRGQFQINGKSTFKDEFVTAGGVELREVDFKTMESRLTSGLFFAGEVLNIDGVTGGFNFQNAWTTAYLAAQAISARLAAVA